WPSVPPPGPPRKLNGNLPPCPIAKMPVTPPAIGLLPLRWPGCRRTDWNSVLRLTHARQSSIDGPLNPCPPEGTWCWVCHAFAARPVRDSEPVAQGRESMPPSHTSLSLLQVAS